MKRFLLLTGILAMVGVANATVEVRIINAAGGGDTGWISCPATTCNFVGSVGNYNVASNISTQNDGFNPFLDLSYSANTSIANAGSIIFETLANGYLTSAPGFFIVGNGNSTLGDTVSLSSYGGNSNTICASGVNACTPATNETLLKSVGPLAENLSVTASGGGGSTVVPYALGLMLTLNNPVNKGNASGDIQLNAVPEPASVVLLGGVLLVSMSKLRKARKSA